MLFMQSIMNEINVLHAPHHVSVGPYISLTLLLGDIMNTLKSSDQDNVDTH